jgi:hypothetical protein
MRRRITVRRVQVRMRTSTLRRWPDLLVIGAQRGGTTSLFRWLGQHPDVVPSLRKEVDYFTRWYQLGPDWYRAHFPLRMRRAALTFEASPDYLLHPLAAIRARTLLPDVKLIVLLRDPVDRAFSHHQYFSRLGIEDLDFESAIDAEPERLAGETERLADDPFHPLDALNKFSYVTRGVYADQLERWLDQYPRDRLLVVCSEDLYGRPLETFAAIVAFAGLRPWSPPEFSNLSFGDRRPASEPAPMSEQLRERLRERFREPNARLRRLLGVEFTWMNSS